MRGRRATPKQRLVCGPCLAWVTRDGRADLVVDSSPAHDHVLTGPGAAEVDGAKLAEVDSSPAHDHVLTGPGAAEVDGAKLAEVRSQLCLLAR